MGKISIGLLLTEMKLAKSVPQQLMNPAQVEKLEPEPEPNIWSWNFSQAETEQKNVLRTQGRTQAEHSVSPPNQSKIRHSRTSGRLLIRIYEYFE